jgi:hypothetical protein
LESKNYLIIIGVDLDGIYMNYFNVGEKLGFDLISFLLESRSSMLTFSEDDPLIKTHRDYIKSHLDALENHLAVGGKDILSGSTDWQNFYKGSMITLPDCLKP